MAQTLSNVTHHVIAALTASDARTSATANDVTAHFNMFLPYVLHYSLMNLTYKLQGLQLFLLRAYNFL